MDRRRARGTSLSLSLKPTAAAVAVVLSTFARITKRVVSSTSIPAAERLLAPMMRAPSQWPGIRRSFRRPYMDADQLANLLAPPPATTAWPCNDSLVSEHPTRLRLGLLGVLHTTETDVVAIRCKWPLARPGDVKHWVACASCLRAICSGVQYLRSR